MILQEKHLILLELSRNGHQESLNRLTEEIQGPLRSYVLRITFREQITDDIVQETLLEMYKIIGQLRQTEQFWPWLCKIALNKIRLHSRRDSRHNVLLKEHALELSSKNPQRDGIAAVIYDEFTQNISQALAHLSDRQRAVLSMRCYEKMSYEEIAKVMGLSALGCRLLFVRAKKKLQNHLFKRGYGREALLTALVLLGKLTAPTEAAAAEISLTPTLLSGGVFATGLTLLTSKTVLILLTGIAVVTGVMSVILHHNQTGTIEPLSAPSSMVADNGLGNNDSHIHDGYYFFPQGKQGPVITRLQIHKNEKIIQYLQNDAGNYCYIPDQQVVTINNYHYWNPNLWVMRLPTDDAEVESFLAQMEGRTLHSQTIPFDSTNLFVMASEVEQRNNFFAAHNYEALLEERFQYNWPAGATLRDNRDTLHQKGWCYFTLKGQLRGQTITGFGRLPFTYRVAAEKPAWLNITIDDSLKLIDTTAGAIKLNASNAPLSTYPAGTFLNGLARPWAGLHVIDTVRRDAARSGIGFRTQLDTEGKTGQVVLLLNNGAMAYLIDMERDLIKQIQFLDSDNIVCGDILFDYLDPETHIGQNFVAPQFSPVSIISSRTEPRHWLAAMAENTLQDQL